MPYSASLDISFNQIPGHWVHANGSRAVDDTAGDDGLGVDAGKRFGGLVGQDGGFGGHVCFSFQYLPIFLDNMSCVLRASASLDTSVECYQASESQL